MPYCPHCRDEYQRGISECPFCGARLVDALEKLSNSGSTRAGRNESDFVRLRDFPSGAYAFMLQGALENEGIPCLLKDDKGQAISGASHSALYKTPSDESSRCLFQGSVTVWVPRKHRGISKEIADQMFEDI
jgi:hypothetical protein